MDVGLLAMGAASLLVSKAGESLAQEAGTSAWKTIKRLGDVVRRKFRGDAQAEAALQEATAQPNDDNQLASLAQVLKARAEADQEFRDELIELVQQAQQDPTASHIMVTGQARVGKIATFRDVKGNVTF